MGKKVSEFGPSGTRRERARDEGKGNRGSGPRAAAAITLAVRTARYARKEKTTGSRAGLHSARRARRALRSGTTPHP